MPHFFRLFNLCLMAAIAVTAAEAAFAEGSFFDYAYNKYHTRSLADEWYLNEAGWPTIIEDDGTVATPEEPSGTVYFKSSKTEHVLNVLNTLPVETAVFVGYAPFRAYLAAEVPEKRSPKNVIFFMIHSEFHPDDTVWEDFADAPVKRGVMRLCFGNARVNVSSLMLEPFPDLTEIDFDRSFLSSDRLMVSQNKDAWRRLTALRVRISSTSVDALVRAAPNLRQLHLDLSSLVGNWSALWGAIARLDTLEELDIDVGRWESYPLWGEGRESLASSEHIEDLKNLRTLRVFWMRDAGSDSEVAELIGRFPSKLTKLSLPSLALGPESIEALLDRLPELTHLQCGIEYASLLPRLLALPLGELSVPLCGREGVDPVDTTIEQTDPEKFGALPPLRMQFWTHVSEAELEAVVHGRRFSHIRIGGYYPWPGAHREDLGERSPTLSFNDFDFGYSAESLTALDVVVPLECTAALGKSLSQCPNLRDLSIRLATSVEEGFLTSNVLKQVTGLTLWVALSREAPTHHQTIVSNIPELPKLKEADVQWAAEVDADQITGMLKKFKALRYLWVRIRSRWVEGRQVGHETRPARIASFLKDSASSAVFYHSIGLTRKGNR